MHDSKLHNERYNQQSRTVLEGAREYFPDATDDEGELWIRYIHNDKIISLGHAPRPQTRWQTFVYHVCHGLIMHYPLLEVLVWSWKNRDSFEDPI